MKIIGSKMAAKLAAGRFGERAYVKRCGKVFSVGNVKRYWFLRIDRIHGAGKSWAEALKDAGVDIPRGSQMSALKAADELLRAILSPATMPEDDDPIVVEKLGSPDEEE